MQNRHHAMDQRIADALERRMDADAVLTVDGAQVVHVPFGLYDRRSDVITSNGVILDIAGRSWAIRQIESYDPDTGDFIVDEGGQRHLVGIRPLAKAA